MHRRQRGQQTDVDCPLRRTTLGQSIVEKIVCAKRDLPQSLSLLTPLLHLSAPVTQCRLVCLGVCGRPMSSCLLAPSPRQLLHLTLFLLTGMVPH